MDCEGCKFWGGYFKGGDWGECFNRKVSCDDVLGESYYNKPTRVLETYRLATCPHHVPKDPSQFVALPLPEAA